MLNIMKKVKEKIKMKRFKKRQEKHLTKQKM